MEQYFQHALGDEVVLIASDERGVVIGAATFTNGDDQYLIRYKAGDGRLVEAWWYADALAPAP